MFWPNLKSVASTELSEIIAIGVLGFLGGGCEPPILRTRRLRGSGMVPFERALVSSYRHSIAAFHLFFVFTRFRNIATSVLQHATFSPPHLQFLPNFLMFRWE